MAVLLELQARGTARAEDLAEHFEVSVRTMYRDLEALSEGGVPLVATPGKGYRLMDGYFLPPLAFTATEAALLVVGGEFVRGRVEPELQRQADEALTKLNSVLPQDRREVVERWRHEMLFVRLRARTNSDARLPLLRTAIQERRVVRLRYHAFRRAQPEDRDVEPVSLVHMGEQWQVVGYCRLRRGPRMFRLDRIDNLDVLGERFALDEERHAQPQPSREWVQSASEARVRFDPSVERWARERQPFTLIGEELDSRGPVFVYAMRDETALLSWLLSWGAAVEVLSPRSLRERLAQEARTIARRHAGMPDPVPAPDILLSTDAAQAGVEVEREVDRLSTLRRP
jgi:predicted DNA-binding transcriptional regulator YafY